MNDTVYEYGSPGSLDEQDDPMTTTHPNYAIQEALDHPDVESVIVSFKGNANNPFWGLEYRKQKQPEPEAYVVHFAVVVEEDGPKWAEAVARTYLTNQFSAHYPERVEFASNSRVEKL